MTTKVIHLCLLCDIGHPNHHPQSSPHSILLFIRFSLVLRPSNCWALVLFIGRTLVHAAMFAKGQFVCRREGFTRRNDVWLPAVKKRAKCYVSLWSLSRSRVIYVGPTCDAFRAGDTSRARLAHSRLCCWQTKELVSPKRANDWSKRLLSGPRPSIIEKQQPIPTLKGTGLLIRCPLIRLFH